MVDLLDTDLGLDDDDGGTTVELSELLEQTMVKAMQGMSGRVYGLVDTYDATAGRVSITPLVPVVVDAVVKPFPKLPSVPVEWPGSTTHSYKFPIAAGSIMVLQPLGHDHSKWLTQGAVGVPPVDERRFSLADLVAVALSPSPVSSPPNPLSYDAAEAVLFGAHKVGDNTASDFVALASLVLAELQAIKTWANAHTHSYLPGPGAPTNTATGLPAMANPSSVACTTLKAK